MKQNNKNWERYICIHGHFYQPPRENPWLEAIEIQDSAHPYHDWNERITAECYAPNATSRILDEKNRIIRIVNNYAKISFNFGPTLLAWMEKNAPETYEAILEADRESQKAFSGHGSALAQAYNHLILPLANRKDKYTQVFWGIKDFEHRFGRSPEGMWLPETAVDLATLDVLAEQGILFTVLAPHQAKRVKPIGSEEWRDVKEGKVDPTMPYLQHLSSGRSIVIFFYDGPISRAVAFEGLLNNGELFAQRLFSGFADERNRPQIVHIATDGESYGHHHRFGDMALAYALNRIEANNQVRLTNYGEYLEKHPPTYEVEIFENTSWSCPHGVERWQDDCGCNSGKNPRWNQSWRRPLREAMDWLRDILEPAFEEKGRLFLKDPWEARNEYIKIILDRSSDNIERFLREHALRELKDDEVTMVLKLLELQRHAMLMYTSCGWFFDDISGMETIQILHYAGRAIQLAQEIFGTPIETQFIKMLERAKSNDTKHGNGRQIFENSVRPAMVDLKKLGAHYAVSSLFEKYEARTDIFCYTVDKEDYQLFEAGRAKLAIGKAKFTSDITKESALLSFGVLHFGDHNLNCGIREYQDKEAYRTLVQEVSEEFMKGDFPGTIRMLDKNFGSSTYSLRSLFQDEKRKILNLILETTLADAEALYRKIYENNVPLMRFLKESGVPSPKILYIAGELVLNENLCRAFGSEEILPETIDNFLEESRLQGISLDVNTLEYIFRKNLERIAERFKLRPTDHTALKKLKVAIELLPSLPFEVNLWRVQNLYYEVLQKVYPKIREEASEGNKTANEWVEFFSDIGKRLSVYVDNVN